MAEVITDSEDNYSIRIPNTTPRGQPVVILKDQREGAHRVHAQSLDDSELYFEIVSAPWLINHEQAVAHRNILGITYNPHDLEILGTTYRSRPAPSATRW
jgi:hypothetical protein